MSEAKVRLKRAKDLIDEQQWQKALEILEHLCREDGDNPRPQALVLVGKCALELQNAHKALEAFRTAVKIQPDLIPAWQGLLMCHSRFPSPDLPAPPSVIGDGDEKARRNEELLEAYRRCLEHIGDNEQMKPRILEYLKGYAAQLIIKGWFARPRSVLLNWGGGCYFVDGNFHVHEEDHDQFFKNMTRGYASSKIFGGTRKFLNWVVFIG